MPDPNMSPPAKTIQRGPYLSLSRPPAIMLMKPTELATENTTDRLSACSSAAIGGASTLHAYIDPIHKLIRQLTVRMTHLYFVNVIFIFLSSLTSHILSWQALLCIDKKMLLCGNIPQNSIEILFTENICDEFISVCCSRFLKNTVQMALDSMLGNAQFLCYGRVVQAVA